jgi:hypothetical protein
MNLDELLSWLAAFAIPAVALGVLVVAVVVAIGMMVRRRRQMDALAAQFNPFATPLPLEGVRVPIMAAYSGRKGFGPLSTARNNIAPMLTLHEDRVEYRVIFNASKPYSRIEKVDVYWGRKHLKLFFDNGGTFSAYIPNRDLVAMLVRFFQQRGLTLGDAASQLLDDGGAPSVGSFDTG